MVPGSSSEDIIEAVIPKQIDLGSVARSNGYPFKRFPAVTRQNGQERGESEFDNAKGSAQILLRSKGGPGRGSKSDVEVGDSKNKSCLCSILISVVICCFLAEALLQGTVMMLWKQTDLSLSIGLLKPTGLEDLEWTGEYSLEYRLKFVPQKYNEWFSKQKRSAGSLRIPKQNYLREPSIALVCANLAYGYESLYLITIVKGLQALGYSFQV